MKITESHNEEFDRLKWIEENLMSVEDLKSYVLEYTTFIGRKQHDEHNAYKTVIEFTDTPEILFDSLNFEKVLHLICFIWCKDNAFFKEPGRMSSQYIEATQTYEVTKDWSDWEKERMFSFCEADLLNDQEFMSQLKEKISHEFHRLVSSCSDSVTSANVQGDMQQPKSLDAQNINKWPWVSEQVRQILGRDIKDISLKDILNQSDLNKKSKTQTFNALKKQWKHTLEDVYHLLQDLEDTGRWCVIPNIGPQATGVLKDLLKSWYDLEITPYQKCHVEQMTFENPEKPKHLALDGFIKHILRKNNIRTESDLLTVIDWKISLERIKEWQINIIREWYEKWKANQNTEI